MEPSQPLVRHRGQQQTITTALSSSVAAAAASRTSTVLVNDNPTRSVNSNHHFKAELLVSDLAGYATWMSNPCHEGIIMIRRMNPIQNRSFFGIAFIALVMLAVAWIIVVLDSTSSITDMGLVVAVPRNSKTAISTTTRTILQGSMTQQDAQTRKAHETQPLPNEGWPWDVLQKEELVTADHSMDYQPAKDRERENPRHHDQDSMMTMPMPSPSFCHGMPMAMFMDGFHWSLTASAGNNNNNNYNSTKPTTTTTTTPHCLNYIAPTWLLTDRGKFHGAMMFSFLLAFLTESLSALRGYVLYHHHQQLITVSRRRQQQQQPNLQKRWYHFWRSILLTTIYACQSLLGFVLMFVAMTYAWELLLAAAAGLAFGNLILLRPFRSSNSSSNRNHNENHTTPIQTSSLRPPAATTSVRIVTTTATVISTTATTTTTPTRVVPPPRSAFSLPLSSFVMEQSDPVLQQPLLSQSNNANYPETFS